MPDIPAPLRHPDTPRTDDAALAQASRSHVAGDATLQLIAELVLKLRTARCSWWTPAILRDTWNAATRMGWFAQRPDIRQRITCSLTGLKPKAARGMQPDFQAGLIDAVIDAGDVTVEQFEDEFDPAEVAAYAPVAEIWHRFRERAPWDQDVAPNQMLVAWLIERLLGTQSTIDGMTRRPILTPHAVRTAIPGSLWHSRMPLEIRARIDELRFEREQAHPGEAFHAADDLKVATPAVIAANIPLRELLRVMDVAERAMNLPAARPMEKAAKAEPARAEAPAADLQRGTPPGVEAPRAAPPKAEPPREEARAQPAPSAIVENAPERPAEKPADKPAEKPRERWERMATRVLEKIGKDGGEEPR